MQETKPRASRKSGASKPSLPDGISPEVFGQMRSVLESVRQRYLDALPIAAAIVTLSEDPYVECANDQFRFITQWDERLGERRVAEMPMLRTGPVGTRFAAFVRGEEPAVQFDTADGRTIGGRHFTVRFARLTFVPGQPMRCLISLIDKTAQVETEASLRSEMLRDSLTGLPNRSAFNEKVEAVLADPGFREGSYAVLAVDMTRFSRVNECMGAMAGDELLITFARRLFSALRPSDDLARTSGDEFGILMRLDRGPGDALRAAERIKAVLTLPFRLSELEIRVDCAIGCAILNQSTTSADVAFRNAQLALKNAKAIGATQIYEPVQAEAVRRRFSMETELRVAIETDRLTLAYQPLIELKTGRIAGFEALARWTDDEGRRISPSEFIPVAEESGLIVQLGRWALETATCTLAAWDKAEGRVLPLGISVNMSPIQISRDDVAAALSAALGASGIAGSRVTIELTEGAIIQDPERAAKALEALKRLDARVAMDDFGTGYTSLASMQLLPIDALKIDRRFIAGMIEDGDSAAIVHAILSLAKALGMETTAEGIDSAELALGLAELGCTYGQGFHYSEGLPADDALAYWRASNA